MAESGVATPDKSQSPLGAKVTPPLIGYPATRKPKNLPTMVGMVFSRLTVVELHGYNRHKQREWLCRCVCGKELVVPGGRLHSGNTRSCGCLAMEVFRRKRGKEPWRSIGFGLASRNAVISGYRCSARESNRSWLLTTEQAEAIFQSNCHYCGKEPSHHAKTRKTNGGYTYNGIDRIDNSKGYEPGNVVACCKR